MNPVLLMVPVDGSWTMSQRGMGEIAERLHASVVLPMHRFRTPIERFLEQIPDFDVERRTEDTLTLSARTLPKQPTVILLKGVRSRQKRPADRSAGPEIPVERVGAYFASEADFSFTLPILRNRVSPEESSTPSLSVTMVISPLSSIASPSTLSTT